MFLLGSLVAESGCSLTCIELIGMNPETSVCVTCVFAVSREQSVTAAASPQRVSTPFYSLTERSAHICSFPCSDHNLFHMCTEHINIACTDKRTPSAILYHSHAHSRPPFLFMFILVCGFWQI